jgi:hypothetical protein
MQEADLSPFFSQVGNHALSNGGCDGDTSDELG